MGALSGLRIVDLTAMLSGPYGAMLLADLGAEVIKIERPGAGDQARTMQLNKPQYCHQGMSSYFLTAGRNKKSVALDLQEEEGRQVFYDLVRVSDVVFDNFRPGVLERLGADYETLKTVNPTIVSCSISGFGLTGPGKDRPAFDGIVQAYGGGMSITGEPGREPMRAGIPIGDLGAGLFAAIGILAAAYARVTTGIGQKIDISMLDCQVSLWNYMITMHTMSGEVPGQLGNQHFVHVPYGAFKTKDLYLFLAVIPDPHWRLFVDAMRIEALRDPRYLERSERQKDREKINALVQEAFLTKGVDEWLGLLSAAGIPCAPVNTVDRTVRDPQVLARDMMVDVTLSDGRVLREPGNPIKLSASPDEFRAPAPLGHDTRQVLADLLHYPEDKIDALMRGVQEAGDS
ncbi:MAG: CoA transferase [Dehalococcoidia bacterium]|jgi:crotonobetainyl-CoA:carnitine CoA-transferase CaiB-like acyl-CoA transferase|nr:CoA transferase [Dehalococcoidia bacterium]